MKQVFESSWQHLSETEQVALRKLSVFQGGFSKEAARSIAQITLPILLTLVNKSFLWRDYNGRFSQHPLMFQFTQQKAKDFEEEKTQTEEAYGHYYLKSWSKN